MRSESLDECYRKSVRNDRDARHGNWITEMDNLHVPSGVHDAVGPSGVIMGLREWNVFLRGLQGLQWLLRDWPQLVRKSQDSLCAWVERDGMKVHVIRCTLVDLPNDCLARLANLRFVRKLVLNFVTATKDARGVGPVRAEALHLKQLFLAMAQPWHGVESLVVHTDRLELSSLLRLAALGMRVPSRLEEVELLAAYDHPCAAPALRSLLEMLYVNDGCILLRIDADPIFFSPTPAHMQDIREMHRLIDSHRYVAAIIENGLGNHFAQTAGGHDMWPITTYDAASGCLTWRETDGCVCNSDPHPEDKLERAAVRADPAKYRDMEAAARFVVARAPSARHITFAPIDPRRLTDDDARVGGN
jgi:hypothetical protein